MIIHDNHIAGDAMTVKTIYLRWNGRPRRKTRVSTRRRAGRKCGREKDGSMMKIAITCSSFNRLVSKVKGKGKNSILQLACSLPSPPLSFSPVLYSLIFHSLSRRSFLSLFLFSYILDRISLESRLNLGHLSAQDQGQATPGRGTSLERSYLARLALVWLIPRIEPQQPPLHFFAPLISRI